MLPAAMAVRSAAQLARRRRVERAIRLVAPALDLLLLAGDALSRVTGRGELEPEPPLRAVIPPPRSPEGSGDAVV